MSPGFLIRDGEGVESSPEVSEEMIRELVHTFYGRVRDDDLLGPIFEAQIGDRWALHLDKMCRFWSSVLLGTGRFLGDPIGAHLSLEGITSAHFDRWIELFSETTDGLFVERDAQEIVIRSQRIRAVLEHRMGLEG